MSVMLYSCMLCVTLLMCLFVLCVACLTVFENCLVKQFAMCCACDPNERLSAPSICCVFVCRKLSPHLGVSELDHKCLVSLCYFFV